MVEYARFTLLGALFVLGVRHSKRRGSGVGGAPLGATVVCLNLRALASATAAGVARHRPHVTSPRYVTDCSSVTPSSSLSLCRSTGA